MTVYVIHHDTRCDGAGDLNGTVCSSLEKAREIVAKDVGGFEKWEKAIKEWDSEQNTYLSEEDTIEIIEQEIE